MNTMAWIAIAAIMVASINSWAQFLLKERSERNKARAEAKPATNQPNASQNDGQRRPFKIRLREEVRENWLIYLIQWLNFSITGEIILLMWFRKLPIFYVSVLTLVFAIAALICITILLWSKK